jgi:hypothetical protein
MLQQFVSVEVLVTSMITHHHMRSQPDWKPQGNVPNEKLRRLGIQALIQRPPRKPEGSHPARQILKPDSMLSTTTFVYRPKRRIWIVPSSCLQTLWREVVLQVCTTCILFQARSVSHQRGHEHTEYRQGHNGAQRAQFGKVVVISVWLCRLVGSLVFHAVRSDARNCANNKGQPVKGAPSGVSRRPTFILLVDLAVILAVICSRSLLQ